MHKKILFVLLALLASFSMAMAQGRTVTGKVTADGSELPGVTVVVKGTALGTSTDVNGRYSVNVPAGSTTLVFSFVGMNTQEVAVGNRSVVDVVLRADARQLSEVVVTGYTTSNKREVAGSITTVKAAEVSQVPLASFDQALQGKAPGVLIQAPSGQPGAAAQVTIRGRGSKLGGISPLYILDGVEITAGDFATLNPQDFESFTILKDASSTSIYGSRGANGVIVIATKKGKSGTPRVTYDFQNGFSQAPQNRLKLMNSNEKLDYELANGNPNKWTNEQIAAFRKIETNWEDVFFRTGRTQSHTLSASGGSEKTTYYLSGAMFDQTGTVQTTGLKRYTGRANVESSAGNFNFGVNTSFGVSNFTNTSENNSGISTPLNAIRWTNPYLAPYDAQGNYTQNPTGQPNPLPELLENKNLRKQLKGVGNVFVVYNVPFVKGLSLRTNWGGDFTGNETSNFVDPITALGRSQTGGKGSYGRGYWRNFRFTGTTSASYNTQFGQDHNLTVGLFSEVVKGRRNNFNFTGYGLGGPFENEAGITPGNATNGFIPAVGGSGSENALLSYFTDIKYGFKERYFLSLGARRDGSSRFGEDRRFANFGSVGLSWILTDESFMAALKNSFINELKLKASYGSSGNQAVADLSGSVLDFASRELYGRGVYNGVSGLVQTQLANPSLQWERKSTLNTGLEMTAFSGRLNLTAEYYNSITSDLFLNRQLSRTTGYSNLISNIGELQNRGVELGLNGDIVKTDNFTWSANASLTYNKNEVKKLVGEQKEIINGLLIDRVGESMNSLYVVRYAGVNPKNGNAQYLDKDGKITENYSPADRVIVGTTEAPFFGGFGSGISCHGFELNAFFSFVKGNHIFNNDRVNVENPAYLNDNLSVALMKEWRKEGDITDVPRANQTMRSGTTRFVESGDFLRLRNVNVSYSLPKRWANTIKTNSLKVYVQGQNLKTWTNFKGFDPEITEGNLRGAQYPALRTVIFGLNIGL